MKKVLPLSVALLPFLLSSVVNAANYQSKAFIGTSVNRISMIAKEKNSDNAKKFSDSSISETINGGYKIYFSKQTNGSFFISPEFNLNFYNLSGENNQNYDTYQTILSNSVSKKIIIHNLSEKKYKINPIINFDLSIGYELNNKNSILFGTGLQFTKLKYKINITKNYDKQISNITIPDNNLNNYSYSKTKYNFGYEEFIGYEYNLTDTVSLNVKATYSHITPEFGSIKIKTNIVDYSFGAKYDL